MDENILFKKLQKKAEDDLRRNLEAAGDSFKKGMQLWGVDEDFVITTSNNISITVNFYTIVDQLKEQRFKKLKEKYVNKEIEEFFNAVMGTKDFDDNYDEIEDDDFYNLEDYDDSTAVDEDGYGEEDE